MGASRELRGALACAAFLAGYGNLFNVVAQKTSGTSRSIVAIGGPLALLGISLGWHRGVDGRPLAELGLHMRGWRSGLAWGTLAGAAMALPPAVYFRRPSRAGAALSFDEISGIGRRAFLLRVFATTPVLVALVEEVAFRGLLQGKLRRALPGRPLLAHAVCSLAFALWHLLINVRTLRQTNLLEAGFVSLPLALAGGLASVFVGGLTFGGLCQRTGSLVAPVQAHWLVDVLMLLALYSRRSR